jgi:hypothetical protein
MLPWLSFWIWNMILVRSIGAITVLETTPAPAPLIKLTASWPLGIVVVAVVVVVEVVVVEEQPLSQ